MADQLRSLEEFTGSAPVMGENNEPIFDLPPALREQLAAQSEQFANRSAGAKLAQPMIDQIPVNFDSSALNLNSAPEIVNTRSGPMIVRRRNQKVTLYRADGRAEQVPQNAVLKYLGKRKDGKPVFYQRPPVEMVANTTICRYCFKPFRPSTVLEQEMNTNRSSKMNDPEVQRLLATLDEGSDENTAAQLGMSDAEFKLANHIRSHHGQQAAFARDPLFERLRSVNRAMDPRS